MRTRAFRRHQAEKKKVWAAHTFKHHYAREINEVTIGIRASTPAICSCNMCGNPRKYFKQKTIHELRWVTPEIVRADHG